MYLIYPETSNRSLESIELMFNSSSPLFKSMEYAYEAGKPSLAADVEKEGVEYCYSKEYRGPATQ